jgi:CBS domain-containing protein
MLVSDIMRTNLRTIRTDNTVSEAVAVLVASGLSALPVLDPHGRAVGVCTIRDVLEAQDRHEPLERKLVLEVMTPWPATAGPEEEVRAVARRMLDARVKRLFVEDRGALVGVVSQTDIVAAVAAARV